MGEQTSPLETSALFNLRKCAVRLASCASAMDAVRKLFKPERMPDDDVLRRRLEHVAVDVFWALDDLKAAAEDPQPSSAHVVVALSLWRIRAEVAGLSHRLLAVANDVSPQNWPPAWGLFSMDIQHLAEDFRRALLAARGLVHDLERGESPPTPMMVPAAALPSFEFAEDHVRQYLDDLEQELTAAVTSLPSTPLGIGFVDEDPAEFERVLASVRESLQSASGCLKRVREVLHVG